MSGLYIYYIYICICIYVYIYIRIYIIYIHTCILLFTYIQVYGGERGVRSIECPRRGPQVHRDPYMGRGEQRSSVPPGGGGGGEGGAKRKGGGEVRRGRGSELYLNWPMMSHIRHKGPKQANYGREST